MEQLGPAPRASRVLRRARLGFGRAWLLIRHVIREFVEDSCAEKAAAIAYYTLFAMFPLVIFLVSAVGLFLQDAEVQQDLVAAVLENVPLDEDTVGDDISATVKGATGGAGSLVGLAGLAAMAWSGSNFFGAIRRGLNAAFDVDVNRPLLRQKLVDLALVAALAPFYLASIAATTALQLFRDRLENLPVVGGLASGADVAWLAAASLLPVCLSSAAFFVLYAWVPARRVAARWALTAAVFAALCFEAGKLAFALYVENFGNYNALFGALAGVAVFLYWVYVSGAILLLGAEVASELPRVASGQRDPAPRDPNVPRISIVARIRKAARRLVHHDPESP